MASLIVRWALLMAVLPITAPAAGSGEVDRTYACRPALPVFCRNIHVSCSGRTTMPTSPFEIVVTGASASVVFGESMARLAASVAGHVTGHVVGSGSDLIVRLAQSRDWIRIQPDGRYSHRIYRKGQAAMSAGLCRAGTSKD